jgi:carbonic anhydrase
MTTNETDMNQTINISKENIHGKCDLKCAYNYQYQQSNSVATNNGVSISFTYDKGNISPVVFNNQKYFVSNFTIYSPSLHSFNGSPAKAEIVIEHSPELGGEQLFVCIPIFSSSQSTEATNILSEIIQTVSNNAPSNGETTNINISLQSFIPPKSPFYNYTGTGTSLQGQVIVFPLLEGIPLNQNSLDNLSKIIQPFPGGTTGGNLYFNLDGPNSSGTTNNGIYISCQPTGNSQEETNVTYTNTSTTSYDFFGSFKNNTGVQIIIACILFLLLFYCIRYFFTLL